MANSATYVLKGYGNIDPGWVRECFGLFKAQDVCIRKLLLLKNGNPACFSMLEIHFSLPQLDEALPDHPFLTDLSSRLAEQDWKEQTLTRL